jgi:hypothetical protein
MMGTACGDLSRARASVPHSKPLIGRGSCAGQAGVKSSDSAQPDMARTWDPALDRFAGTIPLGKEVSVRRACAAHEVGFEFKVREPQKPRPPTSRILR